MKIFKGGSYKSLGTSAVEAVGSGVDLVGSG
jgi:hypothetical protein